VSDLKEERHRKLRAGRAALLAGLDDLGRETTLGVLLIRMVAETAQGVLLIRMVAETAQQAGHADIIRELIDGTGGPDHEVLDGTAWQAYVAQIQAAAGTFASSRSNSG
jgi:uncharacterized protein DUF664